MQFMLKGLDIRKKIEARTPKGRVQIFKPVSTIVESKSDTIDESVSKSTDDSIGEPVFQKVVKPKGRDRGRGKKNDSSTE